MNNDNGFDMLIYFVFAISHQLGGIGTKAQDLVISLCLSEGVNLQKFHIRDLQIRSEVFLLQDKTGQINNLKGKYITEMSKLKHLQR